MGVVLYRKGNTHVNRGVKCEACVFPVERMQANLNAGWVTDPRALYGEPDVSKEKEPETENKTTVQDTDKTSEDKTPKEVRAEAKRAGIIGYEKLRIATLRKRLKHDQ